MTWKLSEWASIAEIIAAAGVIFSLIFVGMQINDGNSETRAATVQAASDSEAFMLATFINHAETWNKVVTGIPLNNGEEFRKGILLFNLMISENENQYYQFKSGYLDAQSWGGRLTNLRSIVLLPLFETWRASYGAKGQSAEFLELLDEMVREAPVE